MFGKICAKYLLVFYSIFLSGSVLAGTYISGEVAYSKFGIEHNMDPSSGALFDNMDSVAGFRAAVGYKVNQLRPYLYIQKDLSSTSESSVHGVSVSSTLKSMEYGAGLDYLYYLNSEVYVTPGASLGYYSAELGVEEEKQTAGGVAIGTSLGIGYMINENITVEGGIRYTSYKDISFENRQSGQSVSVSNRFGGYVGFSYNF